MFNHLSGRLGSHSVCRSPSVKASLIVKYLSCVYSINKRQLLQPSDRRKPHACSNQPTPGATFAIYDLTASAPQAAPARTLAKLSMTGFQLYEDGSRFLTFLHPATNPLSLMNL